MPPQEDSPLEALQKRLYQQPDEPGVDVPTYSNQTPPPTYGWQAPTPVTPKKRMPWTLKFLIGAGMFLAIAALVAAFLVFHGTRSVSSDRVSIDPQLPVSIASGDTVALIITVHNGNPTALQNATLYATLPDGSRTGDSTDAPLTQYSDVLGTVEPGADVTRTIQVRLFGMEGQSLTIPFKVEYRTEGSNALFVANKEASVTVASSPISVEVQSVSQSPSGQPLSLTVTVRSNASAPVQGVALISQYPSGFSTQRADPAPTGTNFFSLGTLAPGEQRTVKVTGTLTGQSTDQRVFRFIAGIANPDGTSTLGNTYAEGDATVTITHPFLNVALSLNRETGDTLVAAPGTTVGGSVTWQNTLPTTVANASIRVALSGNALDMGSINGGTGFYRSSDSSVVFDSTTNPALSGLVSGDKGMGSFSFALKGAGALAGVKNPTVTLTVSVTGQQATQGSTPQALSSTLTRTVKVGTQVAVSAKLAHAAGQGPVPPAAGSETLYIVSLSAKNGVNSVGGAKETFQLPSYVRYAEAAGTGIAYNPDTRTVTWTIGDLPAGGSAATQFQIGFTPSTSQHGTSPVLVNEQAFGGVDRFTGAAVAATAPALTSELPGMPSSGTVK